jgi:F0F1-type ATP synthase assembly protein I
MRGLLRRFVVSVPNRALKFQLKAFAGEVAWELATGRNTAGQSMQTPETQPRPEARQSQGKQPDRSISGPVSGSVLGPAFGKDYAASTVRALRAGLRWQSMTALLLAGLLLLKGPIASYSSLFGSLAAYLPGALFVLLVARKLGGDTNAFLRTAALGEFGKLFLTGLLCAVVFIWVRPLAPGWFFVGMLTVLVVGWISLGRAIR